MLGSAEQYAAIDSADDPVWSQYTSETRDIVRSLRILGGQQTHPVILSALNNFNSEGMAKLLRLLEVVVVRYLLIGGGNTGRFETTCAVLARQIHTKQVKNAVEAFHEFKTVYPTDEEFKQSFRIKQERSNPKVQYFLRHIEQQAISQEQHAAGAELRPGTLTVEHILPRHPGNDWDDVIANDHAIAEDCAFRLGNMCLLSDAANLKAAGRTFDEKRKILEKSGLITTRTIAKHDRWDRQNIDHHQAYLAKLATDTWRFP